MVCVLMEVFLISRDCTMYIVYTWMQKEVRNAAFSAQKTIAGISNRYILYMYIYMYVGIESLQIQNL